MSDGPENDGVRLNVWLLTLAQAANLTCGMTWIAFAGLAGQTMAPSPAFATLPISLVIVGTALTTVPMSYLMKKTSRRFGFLAGAGVTVVAGVLAAYSLYIQSFWLFGGAAFLQGIQQGTVQYYRFAAAESVPAVKAPRAIATILLGGLVAAVFAPGLANWMNIQFDPVSFAGAFILTSVTGAVAALPLAFLRPTTVEEEADTGKQRDLRQIIMQPAYLTALAAAITAYVAMSMMMTAAPLAMTAHGFTDLDASYAIQWHVFAMFVPSLFSGQLIHRFGVYKMILTGLGFIGVAAAAGMTGLEIGHFGGALIAVGIGWNFTFIGSTTLLTRTYLATERAKAQGFNEFSVFAVSAVASFSAGAIFAFVGWNVIHMVVLALAAATMVLAVANRHHLHPEARGNS